MAIAEQQARVGALCVAFAAALKVHLRSMHADGALVYEDGPVDVDKYGYYRGIEWDRLDTAIDAFAAKFAQGSA